jgi:hypothetical protein
LSLALCLVFSTRVDQHHQISAQLNNLLCLPEKTAPPRGFAFSSPDTFRANLLHLRYFRNVLKYRKLGSAIAWTSGNRF